MHYGEVSYGNVGSGNRLDFTLIGPDVNVVSRIQSVCSESGEALLLSDPFKREAEITDAMSIGPHRLKGFAETMELFTIRR